MSPSGLQEQQGYHRGGSASSRASSLSEGLGPAQPRRGGDDAASMSSRGSGLPNSYRQPRGGGAAPGSAPAAEPMIDGGLPPPLGNEQMLLRPEISAKADDVAHAAWWPMNLLHGQNGQAKPSHEKAIVNIEPPSEEVKAVLEPTTWAARMQRFLGAAPDAEAIAEVVEHADSDETELPEEVPNEGLEKFDQVGKKQISFSSDGGKENDHSPSRMSLAIGQAVTDFTNTTTNAVHGFRDGAHGAIGGIREASVDALSNISGALSAVTRPGSGVLGYFRGDSKEESGVVPATATAVLQQSPGSNSSGSLSPGGSPDKGRRFKLGRRRKKQSRKIMTLKEQIEMEESD